MSTSSTFPAAATETPKSATPNAAAPGPLRRWPAVLLIAVIWGLKAIPWLFPDESAGLFVLFMFGPLVCAFGLLLWWAFASRATAKERIVGLVGVLAIAAAALALADQSVRSFIVILSFLAPIGFTAFAAALVLLGNLRSTKRTWLALAASVVAFGGWDFVRYDGMTGEYDSAFAWRWSPTAEDEYLARLANRPETPVTRPPVPAAPLESPDWPGFRGPKRDASVGGVVLETDWQAHPPKEVWRREIGPGWSSFAVAGDFVFTQEQRGPEETVVCLDAATGEERWGRGYESRFFESIGGAGPRATPTLAGGKLFALGAEGLLRCLDPLSGEVAWKRDLRAEAKREPPIWGFSSSPLVTDGVVIVHAGGEGDNGVLAFDAGTGEPRWGVPAGDHSYSSPHLARLAGRAVVLILTNRGLTAIDAAEGKIVWEHPYVMKSYGALQPLVVDATDVIAGLSQVDGTLRLRASSDGVETTVETAWHSRDMKPDFNDFVAVDGQLYGYDGKIFSCVDLATGHRRWKKGRYGAGQVLALPDAKQLLVLSESGEIVLLNATPEKLDELARFKVLDGKTWNHPVLVGDRLYVRNGEEAACFELPTAKSAEVALRP